MRSVGMMAGVMLTLTITGCSTRRTVENAWVRLPAVAGRPGAAYATITGDAQDGALVRITSPDIARIELHESVKGHAAMDGMRPVARLPVGRHADVQLAPGGMHAMLFGLRETLRPGGRVTLTFHFADDTRIETHALLIGAGDPAP